MSTEANRRRKETHPVFKPLQLRWCNWFAAICRIFTCDLAASVMCDSMVLDSGAGIFPSLFLAQSDVKRDGGAAQCSAPARHRDADKWSVPSEGDPCQRLWLCAALSQIPPRHFKWSSLSLAVRDSTLAHHRGANLFIVRCSAAFFQNRILNSAT